MKRYLAAALALACVLAGPAFAATLSATPVTLWNQLGAAQPGDHVQLQSGAYGDIAAWNFKKAAPSVVVEPAPGAVVTLSSINASGSSNLTITGFDVTMTPMTQYGLTVAGGGAGIVFDHMKVHQADGSNLVGVGFFIRNAAGVTIQNSEFYWSGIGGSVMDSDHIAITGNLIHDVNVDGVDLPGTTNSTVTKNIIHDQHPGTGDHPDGIQFYNTSTTATSALEIAFNHVERGAGGAAQGVFGEDGTNVWIHDNELLGTMYNGIGLARTKGAVIDHNFVDGYPDMGSRIIIRGGCDGVKITNNAAQEIVNYVTAGETPCTNVTITGNTALQPAAMGDLSLLNAWKGTVAPPVVTPPAVNPLQATVDSLTAQVASLTTQLATANATITSQASQIATLKAQLSTAQASLTAANAKIAKAKADLN